MINLILSIIALGAIIAFHEFGHFLIARLMGVGVIEFSIGMGPRLVSCVRGKTRYSLRVLPFGGSCMMLGEEMDESGDHKTCDDETGDDEPDDDEPGGNDGECIRVDGRVFYRDEQFINKKPWQRFLVIAAGPVFNFILAFALSLIIIGSVGYDRPEVIAVDEGMPVAEAGIEPGDIITYLKAGTDSLHVKTGSDISLFMAANQKAMAAGREFTIRYIDTSSGDLAEHEVKLTPALDSANPESGTLRLGFSYSLKSLPADGVADTVAHAAHNVVYTIRSTIESLRLLISGSVGRNDVMGPVRMVAVMDDTLDSASDYGIWSAVLTLLDMMVLISGSLGAMNLLPLPAIDGGRLVFILLEMILRKPTDRRTEAAVHTFGMLALLALMMLILFNDITILLFG